MIATIPRNRRSGVGAEPHLSVSQIRSYALCSLQWFFSRRYEPEFVSSSLVFGSAFHESLQAYYQGRLEGASLGAEALFAVFQTAWKTESRPIHYGKTEDKDSLHATAKRMLDAFLASVRPGEVVAVEEPFQCRLAEDLPPLVGFIDLIEIRTGEDGVRRAYLVDHKTAAKRPGADDMDPDQLALYAIAAHRIGLLREIGLPFSLRYDVILKTKTPELLPIPVEPTRHDGIRLIEKARRSARGMANDVVFPCPGWMCAGCGYQARCREWPEERSEFARTNGSSGNTKA